MWRFVLNLCGNFSNSIVQILVFAWFAHRGDLRSAGIFALAWSITHITFSFFGMQIRGLISTDLKSEFCYPTYKKFIALANLGAMLIALCISTITDLSLELLLCTIALGCARSFENMSDLLYGFFQRTGKIRYAGQALLGKNLILVLLLVAMWNQVIGPLAIACLYLLSRIAGFLIEKANTFLGQPERSSHQQNLVKLFKIAWPPGQFYSTVMCRCFAAGLAQAFLKICLRLVLLVLLIGSAFASTEPLWETTLHHLVGDHLGSSLFIKTMIWAGTFQCCVFVLGFAFSAMREFRVLAKVHSIFLVITACFQATLIFHLGLVGAAYALCVVNFAQLLLMSYWIWFGHSRSESNRSIPYATPSIS